MCECASFSGMESCLTAVRRDSVFLHLAQTRESRRLPAEGWAAVVRVQAPLASPRAEVTRMPGDEVVPDGSLGDLIAESYPALRRMAEAKARSAGISPSSLTHEAVCRVLRLPRPPQDRPALEGVAWQMMDWLVRDRLRSSASRERREQHVRDAGEPHANGRDGRADALAEAVSQLSAHSPRKAEALTLSAVCGLPTERIADLLGVSGKTVQRDLLFARAWVASFVTDGDSESPGYRAGSK